jgi:hypothetical protein
MKMLRGLASFHIYQRMSIIAVAEGMRMSKQNAVQTGTFSFRRKKIHVKMEPKKLD